MTDDEYSDYLRAEQQRRNRAEDNSNNLMLGTAAATAIVTLVCSWMGPAAVIFGAAGGTIVHQFIKNGQDYRNARREAERLR